MKPENLNYTIDKTGWGDGPWMSEPDRVEFHHSGFACLMLRNRSGVWCGYVGVPKQHPAYGQSYHDVDVGVHGGLTYGEKCDGERICHVPAAGESDDVFWLGFDCHHAGDRAPAYPELGGFGPDHQHYRDARYVRREVERLAEQLLELATAVDAVTAPDRSRPE